VAALLRDAGDSLQANRKTRAGGGHPDRNAPFEDRNTPVTARQRRGQPVVAVDTKQKGLVGDVTNGGREWRPGGQPEEVRVPDFQDKGLGQAIPDGVSDSANDQGGVSVGSDPDTAPFAARSLRRWGAELGAARFPHARELAITADGGGRNRCRSRRWKVARHGLADALGRRRRVRHFPPGTSQWNKVEHRLCCFLTQDWRGQPRVSREAIVRLIGSTTTPTGLTVRAALDPERYETGLKVRDEEWAAVQRTPHEFHGKWNYTIRPRTRTKR
jgi:hypothetical protein